MGERYLDAVEVRGSIPLAPTMDYNSDIKRGPAKDPFSPFTLSICGKLSELRGK